MKACQYLCCVAVYVGEFLCTRAIDGTGRSFDATRGKKVAGLLPLLDANAEKPGFMPVQVFVEPVSSSSLFVLSFRFTCFRLWEG